MTATTHEAQQENTRKYNRLRRLGRGLGGYVLGFAGVGVAASGIITSPISGAVGLAAGAGLMYASRKVMRPLYESGETREQQTIQESRVRRLGRGLIYSAGMALNFIGASLLANAVFPGGPLDTAGERIVSGAFGVAALLPGDALIRESYNPDLYQSIDQARRQPTAV